MRRVGGIHLSDASFISMAEFVMPGDVRDNFVTESRALVMFQLLRQWNSFSKSQAKFLYGFLGQAEVLPLDSNERSYKFQLQGGLNLTAITQQSFFISTQG